MDLRQSEFLGMQSHLVYCLFLSKPSTSVLFRRQIHHGGERHILKRLTTLIIILFQKVLLKEDKLIALIIA